MNCTAKFLGNSRATFAAPPDKDDEAVAESEEDAEAHADGPGTHKSGSLMEFAHAPADELAKVDIDEVLLDLKMEAPPANQPRNPCFYEQRD